MTERQQPPEILLVVARARNGAIGRNGRLPWHIPDDLKHFKAVTMGKPMVMGRRTFDSLPGLLPGRRHIVLTRDPAWRAEGAEVARSLDEALALAGPGPVAVIGGAEIFELFMPHASRFELTEIHQDVEGDTFLTAPDPETWEEVARDDRPAAEGRPGYSFVRLRRRTS